MNLKEVDKKIIEYWNKNDIPKKVINANKGEQKYFFLDGPPYASGHIHVGTALNKILKDFYLRYYRMKGFDVWCQPGYDCHGMPIETKVEKKIGVKNKKDIEKYGIEKFIKECKKYATEFIDIMSSEFNDLGVWMDWENPYLTLTNEYIEGAWFTFKKAFEKNLLFKDVYPVTICPRCETVVAYNEVVYKALTDTSVYVKFPIKGKKNEYLLIWTTTPWTLPSNTGVMVHPKLDYAKVQVDDETWIIAYDLLELLKGKLHKEMKVLDMFKGKKIVNTEYEVPFPDLEQQKDVKARVVPSEQYVSAEKGGTGLVHTAPGHGLEDYLVGKEQGLAVLAPVNVDGTFNNKVGKYSGKFVKDCDKEIIEDLKKKGLLVGTEEVGHEYPTCWRCESSLIFTSLPEWFFRVSEIRKKLIDENNTIKWAPKWAGKRFHDWLENLSDWPISRQRYWGIPLPIWVCDKKDCKGIKVLGSVKELPEKLKDLHKPYIDKVVLQCDKCKGDMHRIPEVLDVWFDSGVCSWASLNYPNKDDLFKRWWPADLILEGSDQFRGWWNSLMITSVITFDRTPFKQVVMHGFVLEEHGKSKLSKSKGGVTPKEFCEKHSRDTLRYYYLAMDSSMDFNFNWEQIAEKERVLGLYMNVFNFINTYCDKKAVLNNPNPEDKWIISRVNSLVAKVEQHIKDLKHHKAVQEIESFLINDFSKAYIKYVRGRTKAAYEGKDKVAANATLLYVLSKLTKLLAPVCPHFSEHVYLELFKDKDSVHLESFPACDKSKIDEVIEHDMQSAQAIIEGALSIRSRIKMNLRQPLYNLVVEMSNPPEKLSELIAKQVNVKQVLFGAKPSGDYEPMKTPAFTLYLNKQLTPELKKEGATREVIRRIQQARKELGLVESDKIQACVVGAPEIDSNAVKKQTNTTQLDIGAKSLEGVEKKFELDGKEVLVVVKK